MLRKNDELTLTIERFGGEMGIAHLEGQTLFVQGTLPGEKVIARAQKVEKTHAFLKTLQVLTPSESRVAPPCPYYEKCGGCVCQHMTYEASLSMKRERVRDALSRIGGIDVEVRPVIGMDDPWRYRNKTALPVGGEKGTPQIGFYAPRSHRIIDINGCLIAKQESDQVSAILRRWMEKFEIEPYHEETRRGLIRHVMSRVSRSGQVMAVVVAAAATLPHERELTAMLRAGVPGLCSLYLNINRRGDNVILGSESRLLYGEERLSDSLCGLKYALSPQSFFQVNPVQTEKLYQTAVDFAGLTGDELVADLYCGAGTISLLLARHAKKVVGIEIVPQAIRDAEENARVNSVSNAEFHAAAAEELLPQMVAQGLRPDVIVLDPPRKGCEESVLRAIAQASPRRVVYVSCDPATLARDAKLLCFLGYRPDHCQPVDMFCWTGHVETVLLLSKIKTALHIDIDLDMTELDVTKAETKATYEEIKAYVLEHTGLKVSYLYIAQVKAKHGIIERDCYNKPKTEDNRVPQCPPEKEKAIEAALKHFQMIPCITYEFL
ncbi:MAG: 23S rRNA (uracil(1939)-C(5))-methyltransferase RlmD [Clostridia bacterium]|nr:23S rRNA (uracil(1939)-C(5))-methyltransferase RlmD [Clostridia bacterium]